MDAIGQLESCRNRYPVLGPMTFEWLRAPLTDPPIRLALTVTYRTQEPSEASLVLRFDDVAIETFAPSFFADRFDLYITPDPHDRGWESPGFRVEDEHGDWISFRCADFTVEEVRRQ